jgi:uncharacterized membrane protein YfcA
MDQKVLEKILKELQENNKLLRKSSSLRFTFLRGLILGLTGVIGGTVLVTIVLWLLSLFEIFPVIGTAISNFLTFINTAY